MKIEFFTALNLVDFTFVQARDLGSVVGLDRVPHMRFSFSCLLKGEERGTIFDRICNQVPHRAVGIQWLHNEWSRIDIDVFEADLDNTTLEEELATLVCEKIVDTLGPRTRLSQISFMSL